MTLLRITAALALTLSAAGAVFAHGDEHHCKKGYVMTDGHKCVKAPK